jgi:hypothetical protein
MARLVLAWLVVSLPASLIVGRICSGGGRRAVIDVRDHTPTRARFPDVEEWAWRTRRLGP